MRYLLAILLLVNATAAELTLMWEDTNTLAIVDNFWIWRYVPQGTNTTNLTKLQIGGVGPMAREFTTTNVNPNAHNLYSVSAKNNFGEKESPVLKVLPIQAPFNLLNKYASRQWVIPAGKWLQRSRNLTTWENHIHNDTTNTITVTVRERPEFPTEFYRVNTNALPMPPLPP